MGAQQSTHSRSAVRPEIQALRAIAVSAVVLHHGWPAVAPAGYMGVDVFFVVSGFLITGLLLREHERSGRISLGRFYLRRARRILPAAVVVLAAVSAATVAFVPKTEWFQWFREIVASALYVENWQLVADSQNPARDDLASTPVQHYWSLSVEEQFYLVWPLLLILALWFAAKRGRGATPTLLIALGVVTAGSFALSVATTAADHNIAYFSTLTRTWEFGVGGLLAVATAHGRASGTPALRAAASWAGLALIALPILVFHDEAAFPGLVVLLPVAGALAVIWARMPQPRWSPAALLRLAPVQWTGDLSYSLYLWHWPIIMLAPYVTGIPSPPWIMVLLVVLSFAVSDLSKRCIEDPFRRQGTRLGSRPVLLLGGLAVAMALVVGAGTVAPGVARDQLACERDG
ncbi:acyltransferase [Agromyces sp. G08B096]|uniref:Acyltransferase n=1 Tax=Agromyces sp. G08B096 TaxID=3156399 RepID=A0AAU7W9K3_9MICO